MGTLVLAVVAIGVAIYFGPPREGDWMAIAGIVALVGGIYTFVQLALAPGRYLRSQTAVVLSRALAPLRPTEEELQETLQRCKAGGMKIGKKLKLKVLWEALQRRESGA